ncbi:MFS transporter [Nocardia sp. NPDC003963]
MTTKSPPAADTVTDTGTQRRNAFVGAYLGWMFDGYETFATVLVAALVVNDLVGPGTSRTAPLYVGGILAVTLVSWAIGGLVSGTLADRFGRRRVMMFSILWYAVCAGLTALSPNYAVLLVLRFCTGLGMGAEWGGGSSLVSETASPQTRGRRIAFLQSGFGVGFLLATGLWQLVNNGNSGDWRWMYAIGVLPALLVLFVRRNVEDSALWKRADRERRRVADLVDSGADIAPETRILARAHLVQLFSDQARRRQVWRLLVAALASMLGWWAVSTWVPEFARSVMDGQVDDLATSMTLVVVSYNAAGVLGYLAMGWLTDVLGRKPVLCAFFAGSVIMTPVFFLVPDNRTQLIVLAFANGFFTLGQMTWLALYPSELFPTNIRATAMSVVFNLARFPAAIGALVTPALITAFGSIAAAAIVIGCAAYGIGALVTPVIGPETKGRPLPDAA